MSLIIQGWSLVTNISASGAVVIFNQFVNNWTGFQAELKTNSMWYLFYKNRWMWQNNIKQRFNQLLSDGIRYCPFMININMCEDLFVRTGVIKIIEDVNLKVFNMVKNQND